jgi:hypothetical protein
VFSFTDLSSVLFITVFIFMGISCICCMHMFTVISIWIHAFTNVFVCYILYIRILQEFCMYIFLIACWVCYGMFRRENVRVLSCSVARLWVVGDITPFIMPKFTTFPTSYCSLNMGFRSTL